MTGTEGADAIEGATEDDSISGLGGGDDIVDDGPPFDAASDRISGGPGDDVVYTDGEDLISDDCEKVVRGPYFDAWDVNPYQPVQ